MKHYREKLKVLIIEDSEFDIKAISKVLFQYSAKIDTAVNGMEAAEKLIKTKYDLVYLDLSLPEITGIQFLIGFSGTLCMKDTKIVVVTGNESKSSERVCKSFGVHEYLSKPVLSKNNIQKFKRLLLDIKREKKNESVSG